MFSGVVYYGHGLALLGGMVVGGYIGTHIAIKQGNAFVKVVLATVVVALGLKLVLD